MFKWLWGGQDTKLSFRNAVVALSSNSSPSTDFSVFWNSLDNVDDLFTLFTVKDCKDLLEKPDSVVELLQQVAKKLIDLINIQAPIGLTADDKKSLLNCMRILTRILPVLFEPEHETLETLIFWSDKENPLAHQLLKAVVTACFLPEFTVKTDPERTHWEIWSVGVGCTEASPAQPYELTRIETLRLIMAIASKRLYLQDMAIPNPWLAPLLNRGSLAFEKKELLSLLCSLINTYLNYNPGNWLPYDHLMWGNAASEHLAGLAIRLFLVLTQENVVGNDKDLEASDGFAWNRDVSLKSSVESPSVGVPDTPTHLKKSFVSNYTNSLRFYISKIHRTEDFDYICEKLTVIFQNYTDATDGWMPGSARRTNMVEEALLLTCILIDCNRKFFDHYLRSKHLESLVWIILYVLIDAKDDSQQNGLWRIASHLIHLLSGEPLVQLTFCEGNGPNPMQATRRASRSVSIDAPSPLEPLKLSPPSRRLPKLLGGAGIVPASWSDALCLTLTHVILNSPLKYRPLDPAHEHLFISLANLGSYLINIGVHASEKLEQVLSKIASPLVLLGGAWNWRCLAWLLETFNSIVQFHYPENPNLVYSLMMHSKTLENIHLLTYPDALKTLLEAHRKDPPSPAELKGKERVPEGVDEELHGTDEIWKQRPDGWKPSLQWWNSWKQHLPVTSLISLVDLIKPLVESSQAMDSNAIVPILIQAPYRDALPPPPPLIDRPFVMTSVLRAWMLAHTWGLVYRKAFGESLDIRTPGSAGAVISQARGTLGAGARWPSPWIGTGIKLFVLKNDGSS